MAHTITREPESFLDEKLEPNEMEALAAHLPLNLADLPPNPSEEQYAAALVHGRAFHAPYKHPQTDNVPVAIVQFRSYHTHLLDLFTHFASHAAASLGIPISGVVMLPKKRSMWTVPRSPFVFKKSQENFERIEHKRAIKAWDADEEVVLRWVKYLQRHNMAGVGMRIVRWERMRLGLAEPIQGQKIVEEPKAVEEATSELADTALHTESGEKIRTLGEKIVKEEMIEEEKKVIKDDQ